VKAPGAPLENAGAKHDRRTRNGHRPATPHPVPFARRIARGPYGAVDHQRDAPVERGSHPEREAAVQGYEPQRREHEAGYRNPAEDESQSCPRAPHEPARREHPQDQACVAAADVGPEAIEPAAEPSKCLQPAGCPWRKLCGPILAEVRGVAKRDRVVQDE
jgi:hypothetical protein